MLSNREAIPKAGSRNSMSLSSHDSSVAHPNSLPPVHLAFLLCWTGVIVAFGGFASGLAIAKFGILGCISLWLVGEGAGFGWHKIVPQKSKVAGAALVIACVGAFLVAEVCWIHWKTVQGEESWWAAVQLLPTFFAEYTSSAIIGGVFCMIGSHSAYRRAARRFRIVHVVED